VHAARQSSNSFIIFKHGSSKRFESLRIFKGFPVALRLLKTEAAGVEECEARPRTFLGNNNAGGIRNEAFDCSMDDSDGGRGGDCRADCQFRAGRTATVTADAAGAERASTASDTAGARSGCGEAAFDGRQKRPE
jgi:hypothetical protein